MIFTLENMEDIFLFLEGTRGVAQDETYHPEGDVFTHSLMTFELAMRETYDTDLIIAALLHDVGKASAERVQHESIGAEWVRDYVSEKTFYLIANHMRVWTLIKGEMKRPGKIRQLVEHVWFPPLIHLARLDSMARSPHIRIPSYDKEKMVERLNKKGMERFYVR